MRTCPQARLASTICHTLLTLNSLVIKVAIVFLIAFTQRNNETSKISMMSSLLQYGARQPWRREVHNVHKEMLSRSLERHPACKASKTSFSLKKIHRPSKRGRERTVSFLK